MDLSPIGMFGCELLIVPDTTVQLQNDFGIARWRVPIPNVPQLAGQRFYFQVAVLEPTANPLGIVMSNGLEARLGFR